MTLEKAINYLRLIYSDRKDDGVLDNMPGQKAIQLGIEAVEAYYALRQCTAVDVIGRLPSETEE